MKTIDLKTQYKVLYSQPKGKHSIIDVPELSFLSIEGHGDPNASVEYRSAVEALYAVAYGLKFSFKKRAKDPVDYPVMPLEGLWWVPDMRKFDLLKKDEWDWEMLILQPPVMTTAAVQEMKAQVGKKRELPALEKVHFLRHNEGLSAQVLHLGPYATEGPTIRGLHDFFESQGYKPIGHHHELYLGDPRKTEPSKLKTIIRQPICKA
jgi:hypothetical protein